MSITNSTLGNTDLPEWVMDGSGQIGVPPWPMTSVTTINDMTMNGSADDLWTAAGTKALTLVSSVVSHPGVWMSPSAPSASGDGFSLADGPTAPPAPAANPTPGESINVVWPDDGSTETALVAHPGSALEIFGGGFGTTGGVTWIGMPLPSTSWTSNSITAVLPPTIPDGTGGVTVTPVGGVPTSWAGMITVVPTPPQWDPLHTVTYRAGTSVTFRGSYFGSRPGTAEWNTRFRWPIRSWSSDAITIGIPITAKGTHQLVVQVPGEKVHRNRLHIRPVQRVAHHH